MSVSSKNNVKINKSLEKDEFMLLKTNESQNSLEKIKHNIDFRDSFYKTETNQENKINKDLPILFFITDKSDGICSVKTLTSESNPEKYEYELNMVNKYDENLDSDLSFISDFDLEQNESNQNDSFNSSDNDNSLEEEIEIKTKTNPKKYSYDNTGIDVELEKEWNDIKELLLNKKVSKSICK